MNDCQLSGFLLKDNVHAEWAPRVLRKPNPEAILPPCLSGGILILGLENPPGNIYYISAGITHGFRNSRVR
jgi:hypothetical protein